MRKLVQLSRRYVLLDVAQLGVDRSEGLLLVVGVDAVVLGDFGEDVAAVVVSIVREIVYGGMRVVVSFVSMIVDVVGERDRERLFDRLGRLLPVGRRRRWRLEALLCQRLNVPEGRVGMLRDVLLAVLLDDRRASSPMRRTCRRCACRWSSVSLRLGVPRQGATADRRRAWRSRAPRARKRLRKTYGPVTLPCPPCATIVVRVRVVHAARRASAGIAFSLARLSLPQIAARASALRGELGNRRAGETSGVQLEAHVVAERMDSVVAGDVVARCQGCAVVVFHCENLVTSGPRRRLLRLGNRQVDGNGVAASGVRIEVLDTQDLLVHRRERREHVFVLVVVRQRVLLHVALCELLVREVEAVLLLRRQRAKRRCEHGDDVGEDRLIGERIGRRAVL